MPTLAQINTYQDTSAYIHAGGIPEAEWSVSSSAGGGSTFINPAWAFRQDCTVTRIKVSVQGIGSGQAWAFKVFRYNSATGLYDYVGESAFTPTATGTQTFDITPISVQMGDVPGLYFPSGPQVNTGNTKTKKSRYQTGDITTSNAFLESGSGRNVIFDALGNRPYLCIVGDSIAEGHHTASNWHSGLHDLNIVTVPGGTDTSEIANQVRGLYAGGSVLRYQNLSLGSTGFAWVVSTGLPAAIAVQPHTIIIHSGLNDISNGRAWSLVEADLNSISALITTERLLIDEISPWTAGSDAQAATVRTWNDNLAAWCAANNATLINSHDELGQVRETTGELDDLIAAYDYNGVHFTQSGVDALAAIWLNAVVGSGIGTITITESTNSITLSETANSITLTEAP